MDYNKKTFEYLVNSSKNYLLSKNYHYLILNNISTNIDSSIPSIMFIISSINNNNLINQHTLYDVIPEIYLSQSIVFITCTDKTIIVLQPRSPPKLYAYKSMCPCYNCY